MSLDVPTYQEFGSKIRQWDEPATPGENARPEAFGSSDISPPSALWKANHNSSANAVPVCDVKRPMGTDDDSHGKEDTLHGSKTRQS